MSSRKIKEEMLEIIAPELYAPRHRRSVKAETKSRVKKEEIKSKRKWKRPQIDDLLTDDVEVVGATAPRRPYQWRGRKVKRVLRPGTVITFTPGVRSRERASKRSSDEIFADEDILEQYESGEGEFRYGKRSKAEAAVVLDTSNPTPSLQPVTPQMPIVPTASATKRSAVPTVEVLAPKKRRFTESSDQLAVDMITETSTVPPGTAVLLPARAVKQARRRLPVAVEAKKSEPMVVEEVKVRDVKPVAPGIGVQTIDFKVPVDAPKPPVSIIEQMDISSAPAKKVAYGPANKIIPVAWQHPSQMGFPKYVRPKRRRRVVRRSKSTGRFVAAPRKRAPRRRIVLPAVRYHPSLDTVPRSQVAIWR